ncbi:MULTISPECIES: hypothetical protein [unclassified Streptomyces]|uniref:hypothetical protein n=1 Tax=unclassified Streptomyces TaxID=2593676 RepID=UPI002E29A6F4|nr:hypothetical protein [Streptomyces sp. NBC_00223]
MSAQNPQDQHLDASAAPAATPSVRDLLASCAAARTVSTPPRDTPAAPRIAGPRPAARPPRETRGRDAA